MCNDAVKKSNRLVDWLMINCQDKDAPVSVLLFSGPIAIHVRLRYDASEELFWAYHNGVGVAVFHKDAIVNVSDVTGLVVRV